MEMTFLRYWPKLLQAHKNKSRYENNCQVYPGNRRTPFLWQIFKLSLLELN